MDRSPEAGEDAAPGPSKVQKVRMILDAFDGRSATLGLSELTRRTGLAKTSVHRVAGELVEVGLLERQGRGYQLGGALFVLGQRVPRMRALRQVAAPHLQELATTVRETVVLAFPGAADVVFVEKHFSQRGGGVAVTRVEGHVPFHCGASGKVLLAFGDPATRERVLGAPLRPHTRWSVTDPALLRAELEAVRERGYAVDRQELVVGYGAVSAPVLVDGVAVAAVTVVGPIGRLDVPRTGAAVTAAARALTGDARVTAAG